jgi:Holliday junction resolvasome RuvABC endonuclease subunit
MRKHPTILGIDPGTRFLGAVVLSGRDLVAYAVHQLRNGETPYDAIGQARRTVFKYIEQHGPQFVAIESPYMIATPRGAVLTVLAKEINARAKELGLGVIELSPEAVRKSIVGNPRATKIEVAEALTKEAFPDLKRLVPKRPTRPALGLRPRDKYWLHVFDALALALAADKSSTAYAASLYSHSLRGTSGRS